MALTYQVPQYTPPGVIVVQEPAGPAPLGGVSTSMAAFIGVVPDKLEFPPSPMESPPSPPEWVNVTTAANTPVLITNFTQFAQAFGGGSNSAFSMDPGQYVLAQAVYGFFNNGGTQCYVVRVTPGEPDDTSSDPFVRETYTANIQPALDALLPLDSIAIVAAPGLTSSQQQSELIQHCTQASGPNDQPYTGTRFAVLDTPEDVTEGGTNNSWWAPVTSAIYPGNADYKFSGQAGQSYGAIYFPWIQVYDPLNPTTAGAWVPPSGHVVGLYAQTDATRGVYKAPANLPVAGALALKYPISNSQQGFVNDWGINCIRFLNGANVLWGARTLGAANPNYGCTAMDAGFKYVNLRRLYLYIYTSIYQGTQFAVFEPNNSVLWGRITMQVTQFLTTLWQQGALVGASASQAFFVKCDAETNPPDQQATGAVVTLVGVAMTQPAEFVVFEVAQWTPPPQGSSS